MAHHRPVLRGCRVRRSDHAALRPGAGPGASERPLLHPVCSAAQHRGQGPRRRCRQEAVGAEREFLWPEPPVSEPGRAAAPDRSSATGPPLHLCSSPSLNKFMHKTSKRNAWLLLSSVESYPQSGHNKSEKYQLVLLKRHEKDATVQLLQQQHIWQLVSADTPSLREYACQESLCSV